MTNRIRTLSTNVGNEIRSLLPNLSTDVTGTHPCIGCGIGIKKRRKYCNSCWEQLRHHPVRTGFAREIEQIAPYRSKPQHDAFPVSRDGEDYSDREGSSDWYDGEHDPSETY